MNKVALLGAIGVALSTSSSRAAAPDAAARPTERRLHVASAEASSYLVNDWNKFQENYLPLYVGDDDPKTAWTLKTEGIGEWLRVHVTPMAGATKVRLAVRNGYQKTGKLWAANSRAHGLTLVLLPSKKTVDVDLADEQGWQEIVLEQPAGPFEAVELRVRSVYAGKKYDDLCLSDVQVFVTATSADNPAFEKQRLQKVLEWKKERLAAAKLFQSELGASMPIASQYLRVSSDRDEGPYTDSKCKERDRVCRLKEQLAMAQKTAGGTTSHRGDDGLGASLKTAADLAAARFAGLTPVRVSTRDKRAVPPIDGLCAHGLDSCTEDPCDGSVPLPPKLGYLDARSLITTEQDGLTPLEDALASKPPQCHQAGETTFAYVSRGPAASDGAPGAIRALMLVTCGMVEGREGMYSVTMPQLLVYGPEGALQVFASEIDVALLTWTREGAQAKLASASVTDRYHGAPVVLEAATAVAGK